MNRSNHLKIKKAFLFVTILIFSLAGFPQVAPHPPVILTGAKINYVKTYSVQVPEKNGNVVIAKSQSFGYVTEINQISDYIDGLGRVIQSRAKYASLPSATNMGVYPKDLVQIKRFDFDGSQTNEIRQQEYLPFASTAGGGFIGDGFNVQETFWTMKFPDQHYLYSETRIERSPLSRTEKVLAVGDAFVGANKGTTIKNEYNSVSENIKVWTISNIGSALPSIETQPYSTGKLAKSVLIDEKGKKTCIYTDFSGQTILKKVQEKESGTGLDENGYDGWLCTFYIYNDFGQLRSMITPKAVKYLQGNNWVFNSDVYQELCFYYEYDERGRTIVKHSPGANTIQMVYDNKDRLVLAQDENQRLRPVKQWNFYLYDELGRTIATGLFDKDASRDVMASFVKGLNNGSFEINVYTGVNEILKADNPIIGSSGYCNSCSNVVINSVYYFDNYTYSGAKSFNPDFSFAPTETNSTSPDFNLYIEPTITTSRVIDFSTGTKTRVINELHDDNNATNDIFLTSTIYYDDKARPIQNITDNAKQAVDYATTQYDFSGRTISVCEKHTMPGTSFNNFTTITKYNFDRIRRLNSISKKYGSEAYKKIIYYTYDELGRILNKNLSPDYNSGAGLENLQYDYNIQGWLSGINKAYALSTSSLSQWDHYFGISIGYDNADNIFSTGQFNGNITGVSWKTQGDNMPRKYEYEYDNVNRLIKASFVQKEKPSEVIWSNTKMDFSVTNINYDENGNLLQLNEKGVIPGNNAPLFIDKLSYEYKSVGGGQWSNKLNKVFDQSDLTTSNNGTLGDFKDENFGVNADDYSYDANGNLTKDNNKKIRLGSASGIRYNYMGKPQKITIENKSVIDFTYDADGAKLSKKVTDFNTGIAKTTWYLGAFIYEESNSQITLQTILHEAGRIRVYSPTSNPRLAIGNNFDLPDGKKGTFDFFIKDHLSNTRAILTEETHGEIHDCTMENSSPDNSYYEERMFGQIDLSGNPNSNNEVSTTRVNKSEAAGWNSNTTAKISKLGLLGKKLGANVIFKVMAGDQIAAKTDYYYTGTPDNSGTHNLLSSVLNSLLSSLSYNTSSINLHGASTNITNNITSNPGQFGDFLNSQTTGNNTTPQAYLNVLFFDENFNFIPFDNVTGNGSNAWRVNAGGDGQNIPLQILKAPKNGYAFVYLSNESKTYVFFDNFQVSHIRSKLIEEKAYYAHGLPIAGLNGKAIGKSENNYTYQGQFSEAETETGWDEFDLRMYDPQIGTWTSTDPYDQYASPYLSMGNNPVNKIDPDGGFDGWVGALSGAVVGGATSGLIANNNGAKGIGLIGAIAGGAVLGAGVGYGIDMTWFNQAGYGGFGSNFRAFFKGLAGGSGPVNTYWDAHNDPLNDYVSQVLPPTIWGGSSGPISTGGNSISLTGTPREITSKILSSINAGPQTLIQSTRESKLTIKPRSGPPAGPLKGRVVTSVTDRNFSICADSNIGTSYSDPDLSEDQVDATRALINQVRQVMRPGDIVINPRFTQSVVNPSSPFNFVPNPSGNAGTVYGNRSNLRIDDYDRLATTPFQTRVIPRGAGNTSFQNFDSQSRAMSERMRRSLSTPPIRVNTVERFLPGCRYRFQFTIRTLTSTWVPD